MKTRNKVLLGIAICGLLGVAAVVAAIAGTDAGRWRYDAFRRMTRGELGQVTWEDVGRIVRFDSGVWLDPRLSPSASLVNPQANDAGIAAGKASFDTKCAICHGANAGGTDRAPAFANTQPKRATSDWATYAIIRHGVAGTPMPPHDLSWNEVWQLAAYVKSVRGFTAAPPPAQVDGAEVTTQDLLAARDNSDNWLSYSGAYDGARFSNLTQVDASNVKRLRVAWIHHLGTEHTRQQTVPLVANGIMYFTEPKGIVTAVGADTGKVIWRHEHPVPDEIYSCCGWARGVALLGRQVFFGTVDGHLIALDAATGAVKWDTVFGDFRKGEGATSAPLVVNDLVIIGTTGGDFAANGFIAAFRASDGSPVWRFDTIPAPGQPGHDTWAGKSWEHGGAAPWVTGSYDPASDTLYWGIGNPGPDYNGTIRAGDNLYSNCVLALDAKTGKMRWYFQFTPHDTHDYDSAQVPVLVYGDAASGSGLTLPWANRNGFFYLLDGSSGKFMRGRAYSKQTWAEGLDANGRPIALASAEPSLDGTLVWPSSDGATNWKPPAYDRKLGNLYIATQERPGIMFTGDAGKPVPGRWYPGGSTQGVEGIPIYNAIQALDPKTGELRWEHRFPPSGGVLDRGVEFGGLLATAGGLVFGSSRSTFVALDAGSGKELWRFDIGTPIYAAPMTYSVNGRQMVAIAAGRVVMAFALDAADQPGGSASKAAAVR